MTLADRPRFARGVRLRHDAERGPLLLVPEGLLTLNPTAAAALALVDGERSVADVASALAQRFGVARETAETDVGALFERLVLRGYVRAT